MITETSSYLDYFRNESMSDDAFMGRTHALSAVAVILAVFAFIPSLYDKLAPNTNDSMIVLILICLVAAGGALLPDLDNSQSSAESQLGIIGSMLSAFMRATAPIIKTAVHTKYDKNLDNPHRSFYHTAVSAVLIGALFTFLCSPVISFKLGPIECNGRTMALVLAFAATDMALSTIIGAIWKSKKTVDTIASLAMSFGIAWFLLESMPTGISYTIVGIALGIGYIIHIAGDCMTVSGTPLLFPLKIHGKLWYDIRFLKIQAGGVVENFVFMPLFIIIIVISLIAILL